jgi:hypothetical protein
LAAARSDDSNSTGREREKETGWNINYLRRRAGSLQKMSKERNSSLYINIRSLLFVYVCPLLSPSSLFVTAWWLVYCFFSLGNDGTSSSIPKKSKQNKKKNPQKIHKNKEEDGNYIQKRPEQHFSKCSRLFFF